jgi:hypothetical protein
MASLARSQEAAFIQPSTSKQKETAMFGKHKTQAVKDLAGDLAGDLDAAIGRARDACTDRASGKTRHKLWEPRQSRQSTKNRDCAMSTYFFHAQNFLGFIRLACLVVSSDDFEIGS